MKVNGQLLGLEGYFRFITPIWGRSWQVRVRIEEQPSWPWVAR